MNNRTGCAYIVNGIACKFRLTRHSSVFSAELYAILKSLQYIKNSILNKFVIYSDSLSAIESINSNRLKNALNIRINKVLSTISNKTIVFEWVPSHIDIIGNELADKAAKEATTERVLYRLPLNIDEYKSILKKRIFKQWQKDWDKTWKKSRQPCHLYKIKHRLMPQVQLLLHRHRSHNILLTETLVTRLLCYSVVILSVP